MNPQQSGKLVIFQIQTIFHSYLHTYLTSKIGCNISHAIMHYYKLYLTVRNGSVQLSSKVPPSSMYPPLITLATSDSSLAGQGELSSPRTEGNSALLDGG